MFFFNSLIFPGSLPSWGGFRSQSYAPSINCLMQAIAECATVHDNSIRIYDHG